MINKKGEEVSKAVVQAVMAVFGLILIFGLGYMIYNSTFSSSETKNAQLVADLIERKINAHYSKLNTGQSVQDSIQGIGENWYITAWSKNSPLRPNKCSLKSCICILKLEKSLSESCQNNGFIRSFDYDIQIINEIFTPADSINPKTIHRDVKIPLPSNFVSLKFTKEEKTLFIKKIAANIRTPPEPTIETPKIESRLGINPEI